ncbi:MAG: PAS domain S-box protein [Planctomycetes bacterium]|nr:PAS domain S-box protein [Planctomycetota bacterium]
MKKNIPDQPDNIEKKDTDLEYLKQINKSLQEYVNEITSVSEVAKKILAARDPDEILSLFFSALTDYLNAGKFQLFLFNDEKMDFAPQRDPDKPGAFCPVIPHEIINWLITEKKSTTIPLKDSELITVVPLMVREELVGILCIDTSQIGDEMNRQFIDVLEALASETAAALINVQLYKQLEKQFLDLASTKTYLLNILESINNGIITLNTTGEISQINKNASMMLEISMDDTLKHNIKDVFKHKPDLLGMMETTVSETLNCGFIMEKQYAHINSMGTELPLAISTSLLRDDNMQTIGIIVIFRDMTASKELERLRHLDQLKSQFVANVSHELRTPLTSIRAYTEALLDMGGDETQVQFLNVVDSESERLLSLIEDLLNVSRIESGKLTLKMDPVNPAVLVEEIMGVSKVQSAKHKLVTKIADNLPEMVLDKNKMKEVLINLVSNAIKYSPDGGNVTVAMCLDGGNLHIDVSDQGIGIAKEHLKQVFDQFFRVDSSLTAKIAGTGLGLAITKSIVEAHGGAVTIDSEVGKGTTFTVIIPVRKPSIE